MNIVNKQLWLYCDLKTKIMSLKSRVIFFSILIHLIAINDLISWYGVIIWEGRSHAKVVYKWINNDGRNFEEILWVSIDWNI